MISQAGETVLHLHNPADMPHPSRIADIEEPWIEATIYVPDHYLGSILKLCQDRRGIQKNLTYVGDAKGPNRQMLWRRREPQKKGAALSDGPLLLHRQIA